MVDVAKLLEDCAARGITLALAESCTGGMLSAALTDIAGSSRVVERGYVTYSNRAKTEMLGVRPATLKAHGAVSVEVAREMAEGALSRAGTTLALSITGVAGPGASENKPEGMVCFALARRGAATQVHCQEFGPLGRAQVRRASVELALAWILENI